MSAKRQLRWHQCLVSIEGIKPQDDAQKNKFVYNAGWKAHERIQKDFPHAVAEKPSVYVDNELPFDIGYHPDLYDAEKHIVYEIKPVKWFSEHQAYCIAQLSGYCHFKQAHGVFLLYSKAGYAGTVLKTPLPWSQLREIALRSDALLNAIAPQT